MASDQANTVHDIVKFLNSAPAEHIPRMHIAQSVATPMTILQIILENFVSIIYISTILSIKSRVLPW